MHDQHDHDHSHGGHHHHHEVTAAQASSKVFMIGIILNFVYVIVEVIAGLFSHSFALLTDAGHNLSDVASLLLSLIAFKLAKKKPSETFTYGYKKTTILAALINAVVLLIAIGILAYGSIVRFTHPEPIKGGIVAWISGLGIIINGVSALLFFRNKNELNSRGAYLHLISDAVVSAAVVVAGIIIYFTHFYQLDSIVSLVVLVVILYSTWSLLTDSLRLSLDAVPKDITLTDVTTIIEKVAGVAEVHHVHIWAMSTTENALTAHVKLSGQNSFELQNKTVHEIKHQLLHNNIQHATIEIEQHESGCNELICN